MSIRAGTRTQCTHCAYRGLLNSQGTLYAHHRRTLGPDGRVIRTKNTPCPGGAPMADTRRDMICNVCGSTETVGLDGIMPNHRQLIVTHNKVWQRSTIACDGSGLRVIGSDHTGAGPGRKPAYGCGTPQARLRHRRHEEDCGICGVNFSAPTVPPACGTVEAFQLHRRRKERCDECWQAHVERRAERRSALVRRYRARLSLRILKAAGDG